MENPDKSKAVLAKAISILPKSIKIWMAAANRESEKSTKSKVNIIGCIPFKISYKLDT